MILWEAPVERKVIKKYRTLYSKQKVSTSSFSFAQKR